MRAYTVAATAVTLGVSRKWLDNVLSHYQVHGVIQSKQGIARRITPAGLLRLNVALGLNRALGVPVHASLALANDLVEMGGGPLVPTGAPFLRIHAEMDTMNRMLTAELERALEITPVMQRGRPAYKKRAGRA